MNKFEYNENIDYLEIDPQYIEQGLKYAKKENFKSIRIKTLNLNSGQKYNLDFTPFKNKTFIEEIILNDDFK